MTKRSLVVGPVLTPNWLEKWRGIVAEIDRQLIVGVQEEGKGLTLDQLQLVTEHRNPFETVASPNSGVVVPQPPVVRSVDGLLADWRNFYRDIFGEEVNFSGLRIPEHRDGFDRLIVVVRGMTPEACLSEVPRTLPVLEVHKRKFGQDRVRQRRSGSQVPPLRPRKPCRLGARPG